MKEKLMKNILKCKDFFNNCLSKIKKAANSSCSHELKNYMGAVKSFIKQHYLIFAIILSFFFNIVIEISARLSFTDGFSYIFHHPLLFLYNVCIILFTFSVALLCKKRAFSTLLISCLWLAYSITNSVLMYFRRTPFIAADFLVIKSALTIMDVYMSKFQMAAAVIAIAAAIFFLVLLALKEMKKNIDYKKVAVLSVLSIAITILPTNYITAEKNKAEHSNITDEAYQYGFACCFMNSIFNSGINEPDAYNKKKIKSIVKETDIKNDKDEESFTPNIIAVQLESFIDPYLIKDAEYSKDPTPNFRKLKEENTSGTLNVSVFGGGTANTEFEVLTGMNTRHFGIGEYPYETVLQDTAFESACFNLKELGYSTHAIHTHTGTFYDRNIVYKNLGFDTFTPSEYINGIEYNKLGWEKSNVFTQNILDTLQSTEEQDFVFAVTAQCHGKYPKTYKNKSKSAISVSGPDYVLNIKSELEYFVNELHSEDEWLGEFIDTLKKYNEPVMVILYGDHMPSLDIEDSMVTTDNVYQTEYVIWTNYPSKTENKNLYTYSLLSYALDKLDIHNGYITKLHQYELRNDKILYNELRALQYDMLYGKHYLYNESEALPYSPTDMKFGIKDITISEVTQRSKYTTVTGEGFTPASVIYVDNRAVDTIFVDSEHLKAATETFKDYQHLKVVQRAANLKILSSTKLFFNPDNGNLNK